MKEINDHLLSGLSDIAQGNSRKRKNYNFHQSDSDPVQRMLNAFEPGTYVQPHTHLSPDKREVFIILTGTLLVIFFDEKGSILKHVILNRESGVYGVEIVPGEWHTATSLEKGTVVYEIKDGPYVQIDDKNFAEWAPEENDENCTLHLKNWLEQLNIMVEF